ncbi:hypothetical protein HID58_070450, partial [Brassica napus]
MKVELPTKKQKNVKTQNESEAAAAGKGSNEKEGSKDLELENKATLTTIVSTLDNISRKFEQFDSRLEAYELDRNRPLMDQKTIDDRQNSVNSPALAATPGKFFGPKKNLAKELDTESGVKRTLAEEFGSVAKATDLDSQHIDFVVVSPSKATKDDKDAKVPAYGRGCRGKRTVKNEDAADKKKAEQADAALKRKEKAEAKKKEAQAKKKEAELKKKQEAELKKKQEAGQKEAESKKKKVTPPRAGDSVFDDVTDEVVGEENEFVPESDVEGSELVRSAIIKEYREK